jgi:hypothetical protein
MRYNSTYPTPRPGTWSVFVPKLATTPHTLHYVTAPKVLLTVQKCGTTPHTLCYATAPDCPKMCYNSTYPTLLLGTWSTFDCPKRHHLLCARIHTAPFHTIPCLTHKKKLLGAAKHTTRGISKGKRNYSSIVLHVSYHYKSDAARYVLP